MSARRLSLVLGAALVVAAVAYTLYWFHAAGQARSQLERWAETRRAAGWNVAWDDITASGFPGRLSLTLGNPSVTIPAGIHWQAPILTLKTAPLWPRAVHLSTQGRQTIGRDGRDWSCDVAVLTATLAAGTLDAHLHGLRGPDSLSIEDMALSIAALPPRPDPSGHPASWRFALSAREIGVPKLPFADFDPTITMAEISGRVMGIFPPSASWPRPVTAIIDWSKQGGVLELERVALDWPPMGLEGNGTAALDPNGQPLIALSTQMRGFDALMDRLGQSGAIDPAVARTTKTILALMAKPDARGRPAIPAPITVQEGGLYLGPARIAAFPAIPWADFSMD
ncbi:DUF2125 domain-containing protein [Magnetospirillum sulfuroxidans]|uniref:DUF2125 domain-containing protein n=1 Tax=Magnetospirillum sulfuroxidans TaxID=611300 RepID=A0ABS5IC58_9PROT|nr:DUF2125 domain-containing protein [Magnetospirillum sulfuroxidans]MBR9971866.1 DUF2125 domain-containing protein [Magnetospirillum sulfuroxidans]